MKISLTAAGLFEPRQFAAWSSARRQAIHQAVARGMQSGGREVRDDLGGRAEQGLVATERQHRQVGDVREPQQHVRLGVETVLRLDGEGVAVREVPLRGQGGLEEEPQTVSGVERPVVLRQEGRRRPR